MKVFSFPGWWQVIAAMIVQAVSTASIYTSYSVIAASLQSAFEPSRMVLMLGMTATALASGYDHTCALREGGRVTCWGFNRSGQVGNGSTAEAAPPGDVILSL